MHLRSVAALGIAFLLLLSATPEPAVGQRAGDVLAPGAGPLAAWETLPACLNGDQTAPISVCDSALPVDAHIERSLVHVWFRDFEGARSEAAAALAQAENGRAGDAELFMARLLLTEFHATNDRGALRAASVYAIQAIRSGGQSGNSIATFGAIEEASANVPAALQRFDEALAIEPGNLFALHRRALLRLATGAAKAALGDADKLVGLQPYHAPWYELRARLRADTDEFEGAVADYTRALDLAGPQFASFLGRGRAHTAVGKLSEAVDDFTTLIDGGEAADFAIGGEELAELLQLRGALLLRLGNGPDAARDYLRSLEIGGAQAVVKLQLTLKRLGWEIEVDGVITSELRRALSECLVSRRCQPAELRRT